MMIADASLRSTDVDASRAAAPVARLSGPKVLLHLEGALMFAAAVVAYVYTGGGFTFFALTFLLPDIAIAGYLVNKRFGAVAYNTTHSLMGPLALLGAGVLLRGPTAIALAIIWIAHIGFDRALGYGLKYEEGFRSTHMHRV